jgi:hypothetical protein
MVAALLCGAALLTGCSNGGDVARSRDWSPAPVRVDGLSVLATADEDGFRLRTASGERGFLPGINLGSSVPTRQPGELDSLTAADYGRWLAQMAGLGIRVIRVYTLHPPAFYDELAAWNRAHPAAPFYLVQGVYLPDESYVAPGRTLFTPSVDDAFSAELRDVSAAVHGDLARTPRAGRSSGTWHTDVSRWLVSWIVGVEWDPEGTARTDALPAAAAPYRPGRYFRASGDATNTERWLARHLDDLAGAEHDRGTSVPIAFANWPTTDPLAHPEEPLPEEDLVGVDAEHVLPTAAWPGGTFASFHAYPYYPDFQRVEPALQVESAGRVDPYAAYVRALRDHFTSMPLMITEVGVPASLGSAHLGPLDRDQGSHTEQEAMRIDAELLHVVRDQGAAGAFVFSWADEWFKRTWNTIESQVPERRQLWHDPLTNEQWFGVLATDGGEVPDGARELAPTSGALEYVLARADASYVDLDVTGRDGTPQDVTLDVDTLPGRGPEYRVVVDRAAGTARAYVRSDLDPIRLYTREQIDHPEGRGARWHLYRQIMNRSFTVAGRHQDPELGDVGELVEGSWDPTDPDYDSLATWRVDEQHDTVHLRLPWPMLGLADPSSRTALGPGTPATLVPVEGLGLTLRVDGSTNRLAFSWPRWNSIGHTERLVAGHEVLGQAFRDLAR